MNMNTNTILYAKSGILKVLSIDCFVFDLTAAIMRTIIKISHYIRHQSNKNKMNIAHYLLARYANYCVNKH